MAKIQMSDSRIFTYSFEVTIDQPVVKVWDNLVDKINDWWMADFRALGEDSIVSLEIGPNGRLVEMGPGGQLLVWYNLQMCTPGQALYLVGHTAPDWGGPTLSMLKLGLTEAGSTTTLTISDALLGHVTESKAQNAKSGWETLFNRFKVFAES